LRFSWRRGFRQYADLFEVEKEWRWSGTHYQRTALDWLANFDSRRDEIEGILCGVYGSDTSLWMRRWRWFSSPCRDCSVTPTASNGASVISG
jgi:cyclopropane fatty-acyl-phospholipid synthase-like methyltransferase